MSYKIIHIASDEKFINSAHSQFEQAFPNSNVFYIFTSDKGENFRYITAQPNIHRFDDIPTFLTSLSGNDIVIFHSLSESFFPLILRLPENVQCVWMCFGYEIYSDKRFFKEASLYDTITKKRFGKGEAESKYLLLESIRPYLRTINKKLPLSSLELKKKVIGRMNYIASSFIEEQNAIEKLTGQKKKTFPFWYYPIEQMVDINSKIAIDRTGIQIGNSGSMSGNHLDVFNKLKSINKSDRTFIVPLSYGNESYIKVILQEGKSIFGEQFKPLTEFVPLEQYNQIIKQCGIALLYSYRQQAVGNTISLLWFGSKVFLSSNNPFYHYLKRIGVEIFSFELDFKDQSSLELLSDETIQKNRDALFNHLNTYLLQSELIEVISKMK